MVKVNRSEKTFFKVTLVFFGCTSTQVWLDMRIVYPVQYSYWHDTILATLGARYGAKIAGYAVLCNYALKKLIAFCITQDLCVIPVFFL